MSIKKKESEGRGADSHVYLDKPVIRSPEEIEKDILSTPMVTWDPLTVFPKEIYLNIFNMLDNPSDKLNFMNAHRKWHDLFKAKRVHCLFGKVFGLLPLEENENELRLICRGWDRSIQSYYQLHPDHFQFPEFCKDEWRNESKHLKEQYAQGYFLGFPTSRPFKSDLEEILASHPPSKNPFLTRKVNIVVNSLEWTTNQQGFRAFCNQVDTLLETYGQHIWHFRFEDELKFTKVMFARIGKWLQQMPELKTLHMKFCHSTWGIGKLKELNSISFRQNDAPQLSKLQNLQILNFPPRTFHKLMKGMGALEKLEIGTNEKEYLKLKDYRFPTNLREAALTLSGTEDFKHLNTLEVSPFLRKLIIKIDYRYGYRDDKFLDPWPEWKTMWTTMKKKFPALEDLHLDLPRCQVEKFDTAINQSLKFRLNLRGLKRLSVILPNLCSLDFLKEMKGLQELRIHVHHTMGLTWNAYALRLRETVNFNGYENKMGESNIWKVFPELKKLYIHKLVKVGKRCTMSIEIDSYEKGVGGGKKYDKEIIEGLPASHSYLRYR